MKLTLQLTLLPTVEQDIALRETMMAFNAAASYAARVGFEAGVFAQPSIHARCYRELRERFALSSQMAVRAIGKAVEAFKRDKTVCPVFRADGAMTYDERLMGWKGPAHVSLLTLQGRHLVAMVYGDYQAGHMHRLTGQVDIVWREHQWYLYATIDLPDTTPIEPTDFLGIDLGVVNLATTSDGTTYSGAALKPAGPATLVVANGCSARPRWPRGVANAPRTSGGRSNGRRGEKPAFGVTSITVSVRRSLSTQKTLGAESPSKILKAFGVMHGFGVRNAPE